MKVALKKISLYESFDFDSDEDENFDAVIETHKCKKFLEDNYKINGTIKPRKKNSILFIDIINGSVSLKNPHLKKLTNGNFRFGEVSGDFICGHSEIDSLVGSPEKVHNFYCSHCNNLTSLKGAPKEVLMNFYCTSTNIESLIGCPEEVGWCFDCSECPILSLEGAPKEFNGYFFCENCSKLTSLKGLPEDVIELHCKGCHLLKNDTSQKNNEIKKELVESFNFDSGGDENFDDAIESHRYKKFLEENYEITGALKPYKKDGKLFIDVDGNVTVKNLNIKSLTNGNFHFGELIGDFNCSYCSNLENFKGGPIKVGGDFECEMCPNIYSFEGAPKEVCGYFNCWGCKNLSSYDGCPEYIGGKFIIYGTSLKRSIVESFDFNSDETEDFDKTISSSKWFALIKKAVQESVEISIENVPGKIFPYAMRENTKNLSKVITPLRNLIKAVDSSNDIKLDFQLDHQAAQISCDITEGTNKSNIYIASSYPAAPMYIGEFIHKIYLMVLLKFNLIRNLSEFRSMIKEETKILYSL